MMQHGFYLNGQVVSFFSQLIMIVFILFSLRERKLAGYGLPRWGFHIYGLLALDALLAALLTGLHLNSTDLFFAARRALTLFAILSIFLAIFDFSEKCDTDSHQRERRGVIIFVIMQVGLNISWFVLALFMLDESSLSLFRYTSHTFLTLNFLWMALLVRRRASSLQSEGEQDVGLLMKRLSWIFWLGMVIAFLPLFSMWFPFTVQVHATASSYGWLIVCAGSALIFLGFRRHQRLNLSQLKLVILLALLLVVGLVAEVVTFSLGKILLSAEMSRIMLQFIFVQIAIVLMTSWGLPSWLGHLVSEEPAVAGKLLSARQKEIMRFLAEDMSNGEIAAELDLTESTIKYHVSRLLREQKKKNRHELGKLAHEMINTDLL